MPITNLNDFKSKIENIEKIVVNFTKIYYKITLKDYKNFYFTISSDGSYYPIKWNFNLFFSENYVKIKFFEKQLKRFTKEGAVKLLYKALIDYNKDIIKSLFDKR